MCVWPLHFLVLLLSLLLFPLQLPYEHVIQVGEGTSVNQVTQRGQERGHWRCSWKHLRKSLQATLVSFVMGWECSRQSWSREVISLTVSINSLKNRQAFDLKVLVLSLCII